MYDFKPGDKVVKKSRNPFKSHLKVNTIKELCTNPYFPGDKPAAKFEEDDSIVSLSQLAHKE